MPKPPADPPTLLPMQPYPVSCWVNHPVANATAIYREWPKGQAERCRLCPPADCCRDGDQCMVGFPRYIPRQEAPLYSPAAGLGGPDEAMAG